MCGLSRQLPDLQQRSRQHRCSTRAVRLPASAQQLPILEAAQQAAPPKHCCRRGGRPDKQLPGSSAATGAASKPENRSTCLQQHQQAHAMRANLLPQRAPTKQTTQVHIATNNKTWARAATTNQQLAALPADCSNQFPLTCSSCAALSTWTVATTNSRATVTTGLKAASLSGPLAVSSCCMATSRSSTLQQTNAASQLTASIQ